MIARLAAWARQILVSIDQLAQTLLVGPFYVLGLAATCPSADETLSSYVGRAQRDGRRWGLIVAPVIDGLFVLLGEEPGHCRRNIETADLGLAPTP